MLARLENLPGCRGAWVDRSATYLRVRGSADPTAELRKAGFRADPVSDPKVDRWYSSAETFLLSSEEAEVVSGRLVARARVAANLSDAEAASLHAVLKEELEDFYRGLGTRDGEKSSDAGAERIDRAVERVFPDDPPSRREKIRAALRGL